MVRRGLEMMSTAMGRLDPIIESELGSIYRRCRPYTMTSAERMYGLYKSVRYVVEAGIPGDFVECGVWKGGSSMLMALTLIQCKTTDRRIYLYDTFEGMPRPSANDVRYADGKVAITRWLGQVQGNGSSWDRASLPEAEGNLRSTGYPADNLSFVRGRVEETIPRVIPSQIAILRLDTDWYESTRHELEFLYPLLSRGGVLIVDDYGHWEGARKAVDEYFASRPILLNRLDYTGRISLKL